MHQTTFLKNLQRRTAQAAIGPSSLRNQGAPGVIEAARLATEQIDLSLYSRVKPASIATLLDVDTHRLLATFPPQARNWGAARKALNLFLRDATYNIDLSSKYGLARTRAHLEVPLDKDIATALIGAPEGTFLPRWRSIKSLDEDTSAQFQAVAAAVARRLKVDRVDIDVYFWRPKDSG